MKLAPSSLLWTPAFDASFFHVLPSLKEHGYDGFEMAYFDPSKVPATEIRRALEREGLESLACCVVPREANPTSPDPAVRARARQHMHDTIAVAAELGAKLLCGPYCAPLGYFTGRRRTAEEWKWAVEFFQSLGDELDANDMTLAIEVLNRFETYFLNTSADATALAREIGHPRIGILLDTFHANIEEKNVPAAFASAGRHLRHVHACENDRGIPGTGHVDFPALFAALAAIGYQGWVTIETLGAWSELASAAAIWRDLAPSAEAVAVEGGAYLRSLM